MISLVEFTYEQAGRYKNIKYIEERETYACNRCGSTLPLTDYQSDWNHCGAMEDDKIVGSIADQRAEI